MGGSEPRQSQPGWSKRPTPERSTDSEEEGLALNVGPEEESKVSSRLLAWESESEWSSSPLLGRQSQSSGCCRRECILAFEEPGEHCGPGGSRGQQVSRGSLDSKRLTDCMALEGSLSCPDTQLLHKHNRDDEVITVSYPRGC